MSEAFSSPAAIFVLTASLSGLLVGASLLLARHARMYALPGARRTHSSAVPTGGGLGMILALCVASWVLWIANPTLGTWCISVTPGLVTLTWIGWIDDRRHVSPLLRFVVQLAVSFSLLALLANEGTMLESYWWLPGGLVLTGIMNMVNFMDGSHGMAGFQGLFAGLAIAAVALSGDHWPVVIPALLVAAVCAGFLPWNFPSPKIFMGDAGSVPLGLALGGLLALGLGQGILSLPQAALVLSVFMVDSGWTLFRRVIRGERWYTPHKQHVYQRLIAKGWSHSRVLLLYQAINFGVVAPALALIEIYPEHAWLVAAGVFTALSGAWYAASLKLEMHT